jgi:hypothetical protein
VDFDGNEQIGLYHQKSMPMPKSQFVRVHAIFAFPKIKPLIHGSNDNSDTSRLMFLGGTNGGDPKVVTYIIWGPSSFLYQWNLEIDFGGPGDKLVWALMPSGQNGLRTAEFELSFKSMPSVLKHNQRALRKLKHSKCMALGYFDWHILISHKMERHGANYSSCVVIFQHSTNNYCILSLPLYPAPLLRSPLLT